MTALFLHDSSCGIWMVEEIVSTVILRVLRTSLGHINQLICVPSVCVRQRDWWGRKREGERGFFDPQWKWAGDRVAGAAKWGDYSKQRCTVSSLSCWNTKLRPETVCLSFKDAVLIWSRLPDAFTYRWIHVSRSLLLRLSRRGVEGRRAWVFVVRLSDTQISPTRKLLLCQPLCVKVISPPDFVVVYYDHCSYMSYLAALVVQR